MFLLVLVAVIPVVVLGGFFGNYLLSQQGEAFDRQIADQARSLAVATDRELSTQIQLLAVLSECPRLDPPVATTDFTEIARRLQARIPIWDLIRVTDLEGNILLTAPPRPAIKVTDMASLQALVATGAPVIGNVSKGTAGNLGFPVRVPVSRGGKMVLALTAVVRPSALSHLIRSNSSADGWKVWVTDAAGSLIAGSDPAVPIGVPEADYLKREGQEGDFWTTTLADGETLRSAFVAVGGTKWSVHVGMPLSQYRSISWNTTALLILTGLFTLGLSAAAAWLLVRELAQRREHELTVENSQRMDALGKLTGQVAHDFNNLLMVFHAGVSSIQRKPEDTKRLHQVLSSMLEGVARGKDMTQRLLSFSRRSNQTAQVTDLIAALKEAQPLLKQAANDGITIDYAIDMGLWHSLVEQKSLEIALINLVTNAREAMPNGGRITISGRNVPEAAAEASRLRGPFVALTVSDTGTGIEPAKLPRIFEPLYTTTPGGTGLGLTQVRSFTERSGGAVLVSSVVAAGTSFTIYLPRAIERPATQQAVSDDSDILPRRVLIVDDTPASLEAARLALDSETGEVLTARDGYEALETLRRHPDIDGMLSDIMMPGMSGIDLAEAAVRVIPGLNVVLMTGYSDRMEQGQRVDFPVVTKPFARADVVAAFSRLRGADTMLIPECGT
jgi:signal transduction histidine kinase/ActR/RegA family two-component response regulator